MYLPEEDEYGDDDRMGEVVGTMQLCTNSSGCIVSASCTTPRGRAVAGCEGDSWYSSVFIPIRLPLSSSVSLSLGTLPYDPLPWHSGCRV